MLITGRIGPPDIPGLRERVLAALRETPSRVVACEVRDVDPDAGAVDALARLQLEARRDGGSIRLCGASRELRELLDLAGLCGVLPADPALTLEPGREPE